MDHGIYIYKLHTCYLLIREFRYIVTLQANHNNTVQRQQRILSVWWLTGRVGVVFSPHQTLSDYLSMYWGSVILRRVSQNRGQFVLWRVILQQFMRSAPNLAQNSA